MLLVTWYSKSESPGDSLVYLVQLETLNPKWDFKLLVRIFDLLYLLLQRIHNLRRNRNNQTPSFCTKLELGTKRK